MIVERTHDDDLMQDTFWARVLQHDFERAIGPAFQGCLDPAKFKHKPNNLVLPSKDVTRVRGRGEIA